VYILDTDVLGFYLKASNPRLTEKVKDAAGRRLLYITVISVEEMMFGSICELHKSHVQKDVVRLTKGYYYVQKLVEDFKRFRILPFDQRAYNEFQGIPRNIRNAHVSDCRIAAIALARKATVVTNNSKDFPSIEGATGVKVEYWAQGATP
jgi:predicted nucleic acid-binding protein